MLNTERLQRAGATTAGMRQPWPTQRQLPDDAAADMPGWSCWSSCRIFCSLLSSIAGRHSLLDAENGHMQASIDSYLVGRFA